MALRVLVAADFWNLGGPPYFDLRAAAYAFYLQFLVLLTQLALLLRR